MMNSMMAPQVSTGISPGERLTLLQSLLGDKVSTTGAFGGQTVTLSLQNGRYELEVVQRRDPSEDFYETDSDRRSTFQVDATGEYVGGTYTEWADGICLASAPQLAPVLDRVLFEWAESGVR